MLLLWTSEYPVTTHIVLIYLNYNSSFIVRNLCFFPLKLIINPLTPTDHYSGRTAPVTSKRCILYIYSTNAGTEYFKHGIYSPFFPLQNAVYGFETFWIFHVLIVNYILQ